MKVKVKTIFRIPLPFVSQDTTKRVIKFLRKHTLLKKCHMCPRVCYKSGIMVNGIHFFKFVPNE